MNILSYLSKEQIIKIAKESMKETNEMFIYENGNTRETTKKLFEINNAFLLGSLKLANKNNEFEMKSVKKMYKAVQKQNLFLFLSYIVTLIKFIVLTIIFVVLLFVFSKVTNSFHRFLQDFIFSVTMIVYTSLLYKLVGDDFKTLFYIHYCYNYSKKRFKKNLFHVKTNLQAKRNLENGIFDKNEEIKYYIIQSTKEMDSTIENWDKL